MKKIKLVVTIICLTVFTVQNIAAQDNNNAQKTTVSKTPEKVKETLKKYKEYHIAKEVSFTKKDNKKVYKVKVKKGNWTQYLYIDENGKIVGMEAEE